MGVTRYEVCCLKISNTDEQGNLCHERSYGIHGKVYVIVLLILNGSKNLANRGRMEPDEKKTLLERMAEHGDTVLKVVAVLFAIDVIWLLVSLKLKFG